MHYLKIRGRAWIILASACTVLLTAGCGGSIDPVEVAEGTALQPVQYAVSETSPPARANANSFTMKSGREFNGFNPEIWNDRKAWFECDCGRHPQPKQPKVMSWNPV